MPNLKQLTCNVEWTGSKLPLQEHHTIYADGYVETFIAIPSTPTPFSVHLRSHGYIAPGLAMFVYMDGVYQCNRNRRNLEIPNGKSSRKKSEVDFVVRQKEELLWDGTFEGKQWRFEKVKIVPDSDISDEERAPHNGEYVGTIEVVVLRCHHSDQRPVIRNKASPDKSSDSNDESASGLFDGTDDFESKSEYQSQSLGLDGGWDDWGPPPPSSDESKLGRSEMTSKSSRASNPVVQATKSRDALERIIRWDKRSDSRDHFQTDFQKHRSPVVSQFGRPGQSNSITDPGTEPPLTLRGGGPGSYSISSSEAMRNWNSGPPALKEWTQGDTHPKGIRAEPAAFDLWTANLPTGNFQSEVDNKPQTQVRASRAKRETSDRDWVTSGNPNSVPGAWGQLDDQNQGKRNDWGENQDQNQGNDGDGWGASGDTGDADAGLGGAQDDNAQIHEEWNASGSNHENQNDDWNTKPSWDASNNDEKKDDNGWNVGNDADNQGQDDWTDKGKKNARHKGGWEATEDGDQEKNYDWGTTTVDDHQQGNDWYNGTGNQTQTWEGDDITQVTTGAKDLEKEEKDTSNPPAANGAKVGSPLSFGNSRAKGRKPGSKAGSQGKPASVNSKAGSTILKKKPLTFDWLKTPLEKVSNASGPPVAVKEASVPGAWASPVENSRQEDPKLGAAQPPVTFGLSTQPKPKPYWSNWRDPKTIAGAEIEEEPILTPDELAEPVYSIPAEVAQRNQMSHQVYPSSPAAYTHKKNKPKYMDTHESPYAVFMFKYRDKAIIERMLETIIAEPEVDEKARLASLSKQELIDELVKTKSKLSVVESVSSGQEATFVKKLDEQLSRLETSGNINKEDAPAAVGEWVNTTSPTHGQGNGNGNGNGIAGTWGSNHVQTGNGKVDPGNGNVTDNNTNKVAQGGGSDAVDHSNANVGTSWGGNNDTKVEVSHGAQEVGKGGGDDDWGTSNHDHNGEDQKNGNGNDWGAGGSGWDNNNNNDNRGDDTKDADGWGNGNADTKQAGDWGTNNQVGGNDASWGTSWEKNNKKGGGDGSWGTDDKGNGNKESWGADTAAGGGGGGAGAW